MPGVSSIAKAVAEIENNCILFTTFKIWEKAKHKKTRF